jgi:hypothetical protein
MQESTPLSRTFADQGVKLRIRKEARSSMYVGARSRTPEDLYSLGVALLLTMETPDK